MLGSDAKVRIGSTLTNSGSVFECRNKSTEIFLHCDENESAKYESAEIMKVPKTLALFYLFYYPSKLLILFYLKYLLFFIYGIYRQSPVKSPDLKT